MQDKPKNNGRKGIIKIIEEIIKIAKRNNRENQWNQGYFFEKIYKIDKLVAVLTKKKREDWNY